MRDGVPQEADFEARGLVRVHDDDIVAAARVFAAAMVDDPLHRYFVPDARHRLERLQDVYEFRLKTRREAWALPGGLHALALWEQPGLTIADGRPPWDKVRAGVALVAGGAPSALVRMLKYKSFASRVRARILPGPAWYLDTVVVDPAHQRQGLSGRLLRPLLSVAHDDSLPVFLETQSPANVAIYRRFGFVVADESTVPGTPLTHFAMVMNP